MPGRLDPDVIVLDLMVHGIGGVEVARQVRTVSDAYVVMLTARTEEVDRIVGLSVGAHDSVTKPFSPRELVARVQAMLRRPRTDMPASAEPATSSSSASSRLILRPGRSGWPANRSS